MDLRKAILTNIQSNSEEQLENTIVDAIENGEEKMLPGLGVLFELIWEQSESMKKEEMINALKKGVTEAQVD